MIIENLDRDNLHHAYLIEGKHENIVPELYSFLKILDISTTGNPDFTEIRIDNFKIDEALSLRAMGGQSGFSSGKKIFVISANTFSLDAQQALLKMFEEPIENTHFFLIIPDSNSLIRTLFSRFYFISGKVNSLVKDAEKFIAMHTNARINFLKEFLVEEDEDEDKASTDSARSKSLRFLNDIETVLHTKFQKNSSLDYFNHIFQVRKFLRQPGSSTKNLMESVALVIPNF